MFKRRLNPVIFLDKRKFKVQEEKNKTIDDRKSRLETDRIWKNRKFSLL